ncbi:MAG TPA: 50S ribosomal protein L11 methyltransferase [Actinomycetota bacterium]
MSAEQTLEWKGRTGPFTLHVTPEVFAPTRTSMAVAEALEIESGDTVIDVGCGTGVLSFVAARLGAGRVYGTDISEPSVAVATRNARLLGLTDRTEFRAGTLFEPLDGVEADVVIGDVSGIPDEVAEVSGWFPGGFAGGRTGAEVPVAMLEAVGSFLKPGGRLYLPTATLQDENRVLEAARRVFGRIESIIEKEFPLPTLVARSRALAKLMADGFLNLRQKGSRMLWRLAVWRCIRT